MFTIFFTDQTSQLELQKSPVLAAAWPNLWPLIFNAVAIWQRKLEAHATCLPS